MEEFGTFRWAVWCTRGGVMRSLVTVLGSFVLGASCMFLLENHTSLFLQSVLAQAPSAPPTGNRFTPVVPPTTGMLSEESSTAGKTVNIDGIVSRRDSFTDDTLVYGGGAFYLADATIN